jgi:hypothetical protein
LRLGVQGKSHHSLQVSCNLSDQSRVGS